MQQRQPQNAAALVGYCGAITTRGVGKLSRLLQTQPLESPKTYLRLHSVTWALTGLCINTGGFLINKAYVLLELGCVTSLLLQGIEEQAKEMHRAGVLRALPRLGKASEEASSPCTPESCKALTAIHFQELDQSPARAHE